MKKNRLFLIEGESGAGKDTLARILAEYGLKAVCSYATRPMRPNETEGVEHKFRTPDEAHKLMRERTVAAYTKIGDIEYFTLMEDLLESQIYLIDPNGICYLKEHCPSLDFTVVYVTCKEETRRSRALKRGDKPEVINDRFLAEREQFTNLTNYDYRFDNDGGLADMAEFAKSLIMQ